MTGVIGQLAGKLNISGGRHLRLALSITKDFKKNQLKKHPYGVQALACSGFAAFQT
jgi:hypothetical protein